MKGITNSKPLDTTYELVSLKLVTDLTDHSILNGVAVIVSYEGQVNTYIYDGGVITFYIPPYIEYSISFSEIDNYITPTTQTFIAEAFGNKIEIITYVYDPVKDLSKFDIYGNAISQTTANCYVISKPGKYKFPMVYGNAIKNGQINTSSYTNNGGTYSSDFKTGGDSSGKYDDPIIITLPFIDVDCPLHEKDTIYISIADTDNIISNLEVVSGKVCNEEHNYISFDILEIPSTGANAIISYLHYVNRSYIIWNWHIWLWPYDLTPVEITNATGVTYNILPVNLATKLDTADSINKTTGWKNWFYQFGRPTPLLCSAAYNSKSDHTSYGELSYQSSGCAKAISDGITNPTTFYKYHSSYNYNWFQTNSGKTYNLWDAGCTTTGNSDNNVVKTVYDPCPVGFKMPNGNTFTYFSTSNVVGSFANGWKFKRYSGDTVGVFFPASGFREYSAGLLRSVGSYCCVWLSSSYAQSNAHRLSFSSSIVYPQNNDFRASGFSVRPVQE